MTMNILDQTQIKLMYSDQCCPSTRYVWSQDRIRNLLIYPYFSIPFPNVCLFAASLCMPLDYLEGYRDGKMDFLRIPSLDTAQMAARKV